MTRYRFNESDYAKLSTACGLPVMELQKLDALGLLNNKVAVKMILEVEFRSQKKKNKVIPKLIIMSIANKYHMDVHQVRRILFATTPLPYFCDECNNEITATEHRRNHGICDQCAAKRITL